jgi:hypothetical protein
MFIAVPSLSGNVRGRLTTWLCEMTRAKNAETMILERCNPVHYARNRIAARFLSTDCEALWMIDDDMAPPPDAWAMTATPGDIVSGAALAQVNHPETGKWGLCLSAFRKTPDGYLSSLIPDRGLRPYPADACGTGSVIISRRVLEDVRLRVTATVQEAPVRQRQHRVPRDIPAIFRRVEEPNGATVIGEDLDFTARASALGYSVTYDTRYRFRHKKPVDLDDCLDMAVDYAAACEKEDALAEA